MCRLFDYAVIQVAHMSVSITGCYCWAPHLSPTRAVPHDVGVVVTDSDPSDRGFD